jgi:hypothetical protein
MAKADSVLSTPPTNTSATPPQSSRRGFLVQATGVAVGGAAIGAGLPLPEPLAATVQNRADKYPDPIFAAIEAHRKAADDLEQAREPWDEADELHPKARIKIGEYEERTLTELPDGRGGTTITLWPTGKLTPLFASNRGDLRVNAPSGLDGSELEAWIEEQSQNIDAEQERIDAEWYHTAPGKLELAYNAAYDIERDRVRNLIWIMPMTARGLAALLRYVNERSGAREFIYDDEWVEAHEWKIERAVCALANLPEPPMNDLVAELWDETEEETT